MQIISFWRINMDAIKEEILLNKLPVKLFIVSTSELGSIASHPHWHNIIEILLVLEGSAIQQIDDNIFPIKKDDIVIIWGNQIHSTYSNINEECKILVLQFVCDEIYNVEIIQNLGFFGSLKPDDSLYPELHATIDQVVKEMNALKTGFEYEVKSYLMKFYSFIIRNIDALPVRLNQTGANKEMILKLFDYIENNYGNEITVNKIARYANLSTAHFMRIFKKATGMPFKQYLNFYRVNRSTKLLALGNTVTSTAAKCGFYDANAYIRTFKKYKKITPKQYKVEEE
jgi:AraC family transcriptional regulator, transcriptional activator of pobA